VKVTSEYRMVKRMELPIQLLVLFTDKRC